MANVDVQGLGDHTYRVEVADGDSRTAHEVTVPSALRNRFQEVGEEQLVRESFGFLLEREPATSILPSFCLDVISRYFPEYDAELERRLSA